MNPFKKLPQEIKNVATVYSLLQFFYYFNFFWLIQNVFFLESGIDFKQLSIILGIWSVSIVLLEIPSGIIADKIGRKLVVVAGKVAFLAGLLCFFIFQNFLGFAIGMIFWGIHDAFLSGALEALIYDDLKRKKQEKFFQKVLSLASSSREFGLGIGVLIAGFVADSSIFIIMVASLVIAMVAIFMAVKLPSAPALSKSSEVSLLSVNISQLVRNILSSNALLRITLFTLTVLTAYMIVSEYAIVTLKELNLPFTLIGVFAFFEMLSFLFGVYLAERKVFTSAIYKTLSLLMAIGILLLMTKSIFIVIAAWFLLRIVLAFSEIATNTDWQHNIESEYRATTTSLLSFAKNIWYVPLAFIFGTLADKGDVFSAFWFPAVLAAGYFGFMTLRVLVFPNYRLLRSEPLQK